ncbi:MAG: hypothetical protein CL846_02545 [Crocinitomicaceae bacterium]|nr:hypothetical protein [Crocinitomicaceae bacterium]|tara:strand:- start:606 stop:1382 length:777 start_codon:yes stop_codon:yes gene_type:complete
MKFFLTNWLLFLLISCFNAQEKTINENFSFDKKSKVLMIGNSFTFYWNLPQVVERMLVDNGFNYEVTQQTIGGSQLKKHWDLNTKNDYQIENYDYVVFNDHSTYPLKKLDTSSKYFNLFCSLAISKNVRPFVFGTWEYQMLKDLSQNKKRNTMSILDSLASINNAIYVPVGNAFELAERKYPELDLFMDDNKHPSPNGTYLAACVFYSMLTKESCIGVARRFIGTDSNGKKIYYIITESRASKKCQEIADIITAPLRN